MCGDLGRVDGYKTGHVHLLPMLQEDDNDDEAAENADSSDMEES